MVQGCPARKVRPIDLDLAGAILYIPPAQPKLRLSSELPGSAGGSPPAPPPTTAERLAELRRPINDTLVRPAHLVGRARYPSWTSRGSRRSFNSSRKQRWHAAIWGGTVLKTVPNCVFGACWLLHRAAHQDTHMRFDGCCQRFRVVASLKHRDQPAMTRRLGDSLDDPGQLRIALGSPLHPAQRIAISGIESRRDEHEIRLEGRGCWLQSFLKCLPVIGVATTGRERHIDLRSKALAHPLVLRAASSGIERRLMDREVKDRRVLVENRLRSVAMVHVPIHDQHPGQLVLLLDVLRGDGYVVKQTKPHCLVLRRVMARRANRPEGVLYLSLHHSVDSRLHPTHRVQRYLVRVSRGG